ncbi:hypothetical protein HNR53_004724, partial [Bacillus benzoevorans]|nr:hypothetical protein [Bacillus benzoevorans]
MKVARTVWSRGKDGDYIKVLPIAIAGMSPTPKTQLNKELARPNKAIMPATPCKAA